MKQQPKIIIADDLQMMRRLLKSSLTKVGFQDITEVTNGEELIKKVTNEYFDMIICDWDMPRISGIDALRKIRGNEKLKDIPFIMVTAVADPKQVKQAIEAGISGYIVKPIIPEAFVAKVVEILKKAQVSKSASA